MWQSRMTMLATGAGPKMLYNMSAESFQKH